MVYPAPSHLSGLVTEVNKDILTKVQKDYGANAMAFYLNNKFNSLIRTWHKDYEAYGGTVWGVDTNGNKILLFDQFRHGYDAMMELNEEEDLTSSKLIDLKQPTEIYIAFQYNGEEEEYLEDGKSKFKQDYFGWVAIYKMLNGKLEVIFEYECA